MLILPKDYKLPLSVKETEQAIKLIKDNFEKNLANELNLLRVSAPLFVRADSGLNDNLNGSERPVSFDIPSAGGNFEIVHSLAKWKRMALGEYGFNVGEGLYTDMNAIRRDEELDNTHSAYVDQWDWELVVSKEERTTEFLHALVEKIYEAFKKTNEKFSNEFGINREIPENIFFIDSEELEKMHPNLSSKERENEICKAKGAVFVKKIGKVLTSGNKHDNRAPDYDDWELNGDWLMWYPVLEQAMELSSMGIRVDKNSLLSQLEISNTMERAELPFHKALLDGKLPLTAGGGIGQSRLCMFMIGTAHVGEVQASVWSKEMIELCEENNMKLL